MRIASQIIEVYKSQQSPIENMIYYDDTGNKTDNQQGNYIASITKNNGFIHIDVSYHQDVIYSLDYYLYQQRMW